MSPRNVLALGGLFFVFGSVGLIGQPAKQPDGFPMPYNSGTEKNSSPPKSAAQVAATIKLPPGFKATAFAAEPDSAKSPAVWLGTLRVASG